MVRLGFVRLLLPVVLAAGCLPEESKTVLVPDSPFGAPQPVPQARRASYAPAATDIAARVDHAGRNLLAANPQVGLRPLFITIGAPQPEVFHRGTSEIVLTEGLVRQCSTDSLLAAILASELGKMAAEREALTPPSIRDPLREPPMETRIGNDRGSFGPADQTYRAELAQYDRKKRAPAAPPTPPDPQLLARQYLVRAGYPVTELDAVTPLLRAAEANHVIEKQFMSPGPARPWTK